MCRGVRQLGQDVLPRVPDDFAIPQGLQLLELHDATISVVRSFALHTGDTRRIDGVRQLELAIAKVHPHVEGQGHGH
jgi:hypothetical protein